MNKFSSYNYHEELHNVYSSPNIIIMIKSRRIKLDEHVSRMGKKRNAYRILVGKPEGKRPLGRHRHRRGYNYKICLREIGWRCMSWIYLAQDRTSVEVSLTR
jgi:hypothetical protein